MKQNIRRQLAAAAWKIEARLATAEGGQAPRGGGGPEFSAGTVHYELAERSHAITCGGIGAMHQLANKVGLVEALNTLPRILHRGRSPTGVDGERGDERTHAELSAIDEDAAEHDSACPVRPGGRARWAPRGDRTRRSTLPYTGGAGSRASMSAPFGGGSPLPSADRIHAERGHSKHPRSEPHVGRAAADQWSWRRPSTARSHAAGIGTFANRRNQYVPLGNMTAAPACQPARAAA